MRIDEVKRLIKEIERQEKRISNTMNKLDLERNELEGLQDNLRSAMEGDYSYIEVEEKPEIVE